MNHIDTLARTLFGEAKANDTEDAVAIACVIVNRAKHKLWPDNISQVCLQPYQFSCWNANDPNRTRILNAKGTWFAKCLKVARMAVDGDLADPTNGSTHYHTRAVKPKWSKGKKPVYETAGHLFFNDIDTPAPKTAKEALDQKRPLKSTGTVKAAQVAAAGTVTVSAAAEAVQQLEPALPLVQQLIQVAPWLIIGLLLVCMGYMVWRRIEDRKAGLR